VAKKRTARSSSGEPAPNLGEIMADWQVENVVATVTLGLEPGEKIDLNTIARKFADCEYNPERFPGLVMHIDDPKATILIFSTGKMVVTGLRESAEAGAVVTNVIKNMKQAKVDVGSELEITIQSIVASGDLHVRIDLNEASVMMTNVNLSYIGR